jgi:hypothetical protein
MASASFRGMRTRRGFIPECGRVTRWALLSGLAVLTLAMSLVAVASPLAASAESQSYSVKLFWNEPCSNIKGAPVEVLSAFSWSTSPTTPGLSGTVTVAMPVDNESAYVMLTDIAKHSGRFLGTCVEYYPAAGKAAAEPLFCYQFEDIQITNYLLQEETGAGASVQITFTNKGLDHSCPSTTSTKPTPTTIPKST